MDYEWNGKLSNKVTNVHFLVGKYNPSVEAD